MLCPGAEIRARVYVDGFNLYYGAVKGTPYKWLNLVALARRVLPPTLQIDKVKYFTARVSGVPDAGAPARQHQYLEALGTLPEVEIHFGHFLAKTIWRPITNLPVGGAVIHADPPVVMPVGDHAVDGPRPRRLPVGRYRSSERRRDPDMRRPLPDALIVEVHAMEEKGSDVNLATHLLNDAWSNAFDAAAVISNDTDLVAPIRMVSVERGKPIYVVCPAERRISPPLAQAATYVRHIHKAMLRQSQFPDAIPGTNIRKPANW